MKMSDKSVISECNRLGFKSLFMCGFFFAAAISRAQESRPSGWVVIPVAEYRAAR